VPTPASSANRPGPPPSKACSRSGAAGRRSDGFDDDVWTPPKGAAAEGHLDPVAELSRAPAGAVRPGALALTRISRLRARAGDVEDALFPRRLRASRRLRHEAQARLQVPSSRRTARYPFPRAPPRPLAFRRRQTGWLRVRDRDEHTGYSSPLACDRKIRTASIVSSASGLSPSVRSAQTPFDGAQGLFERQSIACMRGGPRHELL